MSLKKFVLTASAAALLAGPALADGGPVPEPAPPPPPAPVEDEPPPPPPPAPSAYDWSGAYLGVQLGYAWGDADHVFEFELPSGDSSPDGILGGGHLGYQVQGGAWIYGIEGDFDYTGIEGDYSVGGPGAPSSSGSSEINYQGTLRFRLGHAVDRTLLYVTGGAAFADVELGGGIPDCCFGTFERTAFGWTAGGGGEYAFTDDVSARLEYRYTDYNPEDDNIVELKLLNMEVDMSLHTVYAGVSYHF